MQKKAYEWRMSDWSSDVCSSDLRRRLCCLDDGDEIVDVGQVNSQTFQHMTALARLAQLEYRSARHHFATMQQEVFDHLLQIQQAGLAIDQSHHIHAEGILKLGVLVQKIGRASCRDRVCQYV